jgi:hypothetical protein
MNSKVHDIQSVWVDDTYLHLEVDGDRCRVRLADCSTQLMQASVAQRQWFEVSPDGYGIHWPALDEDLAITPLLEQAERECASAESITP